MSNQPTIDIRDTRLALLSAFSVLEWILVREKKRLGPQDVTRMLKEIDVARSLLGDENNAE